MKIKVLVRTIVILLFVVTNLYADDPDIKIDFQHFTSKDGLPHNYINAIYQDTDGFIWLATRNGVCRYDGYNFESYKYRLGDNTLTSLFTTEIIESTEGEIWTFGGGVMSRKVGAVIQVFSNNYEFAYPDSNGNIWFIVDGILTRVEQKFVDDLGSTSNSLAGRLRLVIKEKNNQRWVFYDFTQQEIINSSKGFYYSYSIPNQHEEEHNIQSIYIDSENSIWICTSNNGLIHFDPEKEEFRNYNYESDGKGIASNTVHAVYEIDKDHLWIGTFEGLNILNKTDGSIQLIKNDLSDLSSLSDNIVTCFLKDRAENIFVGSRYGLNIIKDRKFKHVFMVEEENSILSNNVHGFCEDNEKNSWVITSGGMSKFDAKTQYLINYPVDHEKLNSLKGPPISIIPDDKDNLWVGTWAAGLYYFDKTNESFKAYTQNFSVKNSISGNNIMSLFRDSKNRIWIGTWGDGVNLYNPKEDNFEIFSSEQDSNHGLSDHDVSSFAEDAFGRIWIGTLDGLNLLEDEKNKIFRHFRPGEDMNRDISNNQITSLYASGIYLWVGTANGLNKLNVVDYSNERILMEDGLPSNQIKAMLQDDQGSLWVSTNRGLAKIVFESEKDQVVKRIYSFTLSDGLQENEFLDRSVYKKSNGELLFGGTNGFNIFSPEDVSIDTIPPSCVLNKLYIDDREIIPGDTVFGTIPLKEALSKAGSIEISYKQNSFSIEFAGLHFTKPDEITYKYMLEGFDENWKTTDSKHRIASYTNINKGKYRLLVNASNSNGFWGKDPVALEIEVVPPFWRTNGFKVLLYLSIAFIIFLIIDLRTKIITKQKIKLEKTVKKRTSELLEQKNNIEKQKEEIKSQADQIRSMNDLLRKHNIELEDNIENLSKARVMQKLLDFNEFNKIFKDEDECQQYLTELKWGEGYHCSRCNSTVYSLEDNQSRRCKKCNYKESPTSGTIFHHLRFPLNKALYILILTSTGRKINISELSRTLDLRLKTTWNFHNKVKDEIKRLKSPIKSDKGWTSLIITPPTGKRDFGYD